MREEYWQTGIIKVLEDIAEAAPGRRPWATSGKEPHTVSHPTHDLHVSEAPQCLKNQA